MESYECIEKVTDYIEDNSSSFNCDPLGDIWINFILRNVILKTLSLKETRSE